MAAPINREMAILRQSGTRGPVRPETEARARRGEEFPRVRVPVRPETRA